MLIENTDVYHITIVGENPHHLAIEMNQDSPFTDGGACVHQRIEKDGEVLGGVVEVWGLEHLSPAQDAYLEKHSALAVRHVWPE